MSRFISFFAFLLAYGELTVHSQQSESSWSLDDCNAKVNTNHLGDRSHSEEESSCFVTNLYRWQTDTRLKAYQKLAKADDTLNMCYEDKIQNEQFRTHRGCTFRPLKEQPICYFNTDFTCSLAKSVQFYARASSVDCFYTEALYNAAKADDVETISDLRDRGTNMSVVIMIKLDRGEQLTMSLVDYAAAYGSFSVLEDLILAEEDSDCKTREVLRSVLCIFSSGSHCDSASTKRKAIERLLLHYESSCRPHVLSRAIGTPTTCRRFPYFVSLRWSFGNSYEHYCGGVLIENNTVLTAAHCIDPIYGNPTEPILLIESDASQPGLSFCSTTVEIRRSAETFIHAGWFQGLSARSLGNQDDIALIRLNRQSKKQPIQWRERKYLKVGEVLTGIGLGRTGQTNSFSPLLQQYQGEVRKLRICKKSYNFAFPKGILCVGGSGPDFCEGDDGGPLISFGDDPSKDHLVAIAHLKDNRIPCGSAGTPGLFIEVKRHRKWIKTNL